MISLITITVIFTIGLFSYKNIGFTHMKPYQPMMEDIEFQEEGNWSRHHRQPYSNQFHCHDAFYWDEAGVR